MKTFFETPESVDLISVDPDNYKMLVAVATQIYVFQNYHSMQK